MTNNNTLTINTPLGVHELELALARELAAWRDWDLRVAAVELTMMKRICRKASWVKDFRPLVEKLEQAIKATEKTVKEKDVTLILAAHTRLEQAVFAMRDELYK